MDFEGTLIHELPEEGGTSKSGNAWRKKTWVFETQNGSFTNQIAVNAMGDRIDNFKFEAGKRYNVSIDVQSREYNGKWYTDARVFAYRPLDDAAAAASAPTAGGFGQPAAQPAPAAPAFGQPAPQQVDPFAGGDSNTDDLPF